MEALSSVLDYALSYARLGWPVFPIISGGKLPFKGTNGFEDASCDEKIIKAGLKRRRQCNLAIATGDCFWVLDVDPRHGGHETLAILQATHGDLPETLHAKTGGGGEHILFRGDPRIRNSTGKLGPGLDTRGYGGYVLVEPSTTQSQYSFLDWCVGDGQPPAIAAAPDWIFSALTKPGKPGGDFARDENGNIQEGYRDGVLTSLAGFMRRPGFCTEAIYAALAVENAQHCKPPKADADIRRIASSIGSKDPQGDLTREAVSLVTMWREIGLKLNDKDTPFANEANAALLMASHEDWRGRISYDEFHQRIFVTAEAAAREWSDADDIQGAVWAQTVCAMPRLGVDTVRKAVTLVARKNIKNECAQWLRSLKFDGEPRIEFFLSELMGAEEGNYTSAVSRNFWLSLAARALNPGCQMDNMMVLEGKQGIGKSSALRIIGGAWYAEAHESLREKDFFLALQGKLLVEITEMDAFSRADIARAKQVVTCRVDRYRAPYDARTVDHPRYTVFCGTTNDDAYLRDATGARRFWPVRCNEIRLDLLQYQREQLFAEAVQRYLAGESWWEMPIEETVQAQEERRYTDPWEDAVLIYLIGKSRVLVPDVLGNLGIELKNYDKAAQMRVADILTANGWCRTRFFESGRRFRAWTKQS